MPSPPIDVRRRGHPRAAWIAICLGLLFGSISPALAQDSSASAAYQEAVREALAEYDAQNYLEARSLFEQAHELSPNARTLRGLGVVSFELKRYSECVQFLRQALASDQKPLSESMREQVAQLLSRARRFVAQLTVTVEPADARVVIDRSDPRTLPKEPLLLDVGVHQLEFHAPGYLTEPRSFTAVGGEKKTWNISLRRESHDVGLTASSSVRDPRMGRQPRRWRLVLGGSAVVVGVASFVVAGVLTSKRHDAGERLRASNGSAEEILSPRLQDWVDTRGMPYLFGSLGAVALTSGAVGVLLSAEREALPWWASALLGSAGVGLASWGIADVSRGGSCRGEPRERVACSEKLEQRDRGALVLLSAVPLLSVSITQLLRWSLASDSPSTSVLVTPQVDARQTTITLDVRVQHF